MIPRGSRGFFLLNPKSEFRNPKYARVLATALLLVASGCAARRPRTFAPAAEQDAAKAISAWKEAVARAESLAPSRLLYEARLTQGLVRVPGTLAVEESRGAVEASLTGPFGSPVARYREGALRGEGIKPLTIAPEELRALLAGVWNGSTPQVRGIDGTDALLVWEGEPHVEGVLDVARARFRSLRVTRAEGTILATYSGEWNPWPARIEVEDAGGGGHLRLTLLARENLD